jgi:hypothetical protein
VLGKIQNHAAIGGFQFDIQEVLEALAGSLPAFKVIGHTTNSHQISVTDQLKVCRQK